MSIAKVHLLGNPYLRVGESRHPLVPKDALLLCMVALQAPAQRDRVATALWPRGEAASSLNNLRQRLHRLSRTTGISWIRYRPLLELGAGIDIDMPVAGGPSDALLDLDLLEGVTIDDAPQAQRWLEEQRQRWRERCVKALLDRAAASGPDGAALAALRHATQRSPTHLAAHARLMRHLYAGGDAAAALSVFDELSNRLPDGPGAELSELAAWIRSNRSRLELDERLLAALARPPRLVGREMERVQLQRNVDGRRPTFLIAEGGLGKSRLLDDLAERNPGALREGGRPHDSTRAYALATRLVVAAAGLSGAHPDSFGPFGHLLGLPTAGTRSPAPGPTFAGLRIALCNALHAIPLLLLDDLHLADEASIELLAAVIEASRPPAAVLALRPPAGDSKVTAWMSALGTDADVMPLAPLDRHGLSALLNSLDLPQPLDEDGVERLLRHAGGHPFHTLETLHTVLLQGGSLAGPLPVPELVRRGLVQRLEALGERATMLARLAAWAGEDFGVDLAASVLAVQPLQLTPAWTALRDARFFDGENLRHDLLRESLQHDTPAALARWLRATLARWLRDRSLAPDREAAHWLAAGDSAAAGHAWRRAATAALKASRRRDEAALLQRAIDAFVDAGLVDEAFDCRVEQLGALVQSDAQRQLSAADELLELARSSIQQARAQVARAEVLNNVGRFDEVVAALPDALNFALEAGDGDLTLVAARRLAYACVNLGQAERGVEVLQNALPMAEASRNPAARAEFYGEYGNVLAQANRRAEAIPLQRLGIEWSERVGNRVDALTGLSNLGVNLLQQGDMVGARDCFEQAIASPLFAEQAGGLGLGVRINLAQALRDQGEFAAALTALEDARVGLPVEGASVWRAVCDGTQAQLWLAIGQTARAWHLVSHDPDPAPPFVAAMLLLVRAQVQARLGLPWAATLQAAREALQPGPRADVHLRIEAQRCLLLEPAQAADHARNLQDMATRLGLRGLAALALVRMADALRTLGAAEALEAARQAELELQSCTPLGSYLPDCWRTLGTVMLECGDADGALRVLRTADEWIERASWRVPEQLRESYLRNHSVHDALQLLRRRASRGSHPHP